MKREGNNNILVVNVKIRAAFKHVTSPHIGLSLSEKESNVYAFIKNAAKR